MDKETIFEKLKENKMKIGIVGLVIILLACVVGGLYMMGVVGDYAYAMDGKTYLVVKGNNYHVEVMQTNVDRGVNGSYWDMYTVMPKTDIQVNGVTKIPINQDTKYLFIDSSKSGNYMNENETIVFEVVDNGKVISSSESQAGYFSYYGRYVVDGGYFVYA